MLRKKRFGDFLIFSKCAKKSYLLHITIFSIFHCVIFKLFYSLFYTYIYIYVYIYIFFRILFFKMCMRQQPCIISYQNLQTRHIKNANLSIYIYIYTYIYIYIIYIYIYIHIYIYIYRPVSF